MTDLERRIYRLERRLRAWQLATTFAVAGALVWSCDRSPPTSIVAGGMTLDSQHLQFASEGYTATLSAAGLVINKSTDKTRATIGPGSLDVGSPGGTLSIQTPSSEQGVALMLSSHPGGVIRMATSNGGAELDAHEGDVRDSETLHTRRVSVQATANGAWLHVPGATVSDTK